MRSYQIIPKKYRPASFATIVGQDVIVTTLKNALRHHRLANAYLFCGVRGTGKTTIAHLCEGHQLPSPHRRGRAMQPVPLLSCH